MRLPKGVTRREAKVDTRQSNGANKELVPNLLYNMRRILPGSFLEDLSGHFFPQNQEKQYGDKILRKDPEAQKMKNPFGQNPPLTLSPILQGCCFAWYYLSDMDKWGHCKRGLFSESISRVSEFSTISRK